jgi:hypothetical protein
VFKNMIRNNDLLPPYEEACCSGSMIHLLDTNRPPLVKPSLNGQKNWCNFAA